MLLFLEKGSCLASPCAVAMVFFIAMEEGQNVETAECKKHWENRSAIISVHFSNKRVSAAPSVQELGFGAGLLEEEETVF